MSWTVSLIPEAESELVRMPADIRARFLRVAELLETFGPQHVGMPQVRPLEDKLREMRMKGRGGIARAVYPVRWGAEADRPPPFHEEDPEDPARCDQDRSRPT